MAWIPCGTQAGDCVCLLHGRPIPVVLQKYEDGHRLLGSCFVEGVRDYEELGFLKENVRDITIY
jgi:hypothetical protein